jgi:hypothetical protein
MMKNTRHGPYSAPPAQVVAFLGYLLSLVPSKAEASEWATLTNEKLAFYKRGFPPGTMSSTIPKDDMTKGPSDPDYTILQGVTVHIIRWDLNFPEVFLPCSFCNDGELVLSAGTASKIKKLTPVFDISVPTEWVAAMWYKCKCGKMQAMMAI